MLYADPESNAKGRIIGGVATLAYILLVLLLLLFVQWTMDTPEEGEGILINFGNVDEAAPGGDLAINDQTADVQQQARAQAQSQQAQQDYLTQDIEDAPEVPTQANQQQQQNERNNPTNQTETTPAETPREVNQRALFPGRTEGSTATSDGTGTGVGNQGNPAGDPAGSHDGTGLGNSGNSASLSGRSLVGSLPRPDYNVREQGRVVIEIYVDQQGRVTLVDHRSVGSTTQNSALVEAALRAARQARFNVNVDAPLSQKGTITYNFLLQ